MEDKSKPSKQKKNINKKKARYFDSTEEPEGDGSHHSQREEKHIQSNDSSPDLVKENFKMKRESYFDANEETEVDGAHNFKTPGKRFKSNDFSYSPQKPHQAEGDFNIKKERYFDSNEETEVDGAHDFKRPGKRLKSNDSSYSPQKPFRNAPYHNRNQNHANEENSVEDKKINDLVKYYEEILQTLKTIPKEDTEMFVMNALQESKGYEVKISSSRLSSRCIEVLLSTCTDPDVLIQYMDAFSKEKIEVCTNAKASHVTELLLSIAIQNIQNWESVMESEEDTTEKKNVSYFISWLIEFGDFVVEHFESCLQDHYASHVVCVIIQALGGDMSKVFSSKKSVSHKKDFHQQYVGEEDSDINLHKTSVVLDNIPKFFSKMLKKLSKSLLKIDAIADYVTESSSAIVIETLLCVLKKRIPKRCRKLVHRLSDKIFSERNDAGVPLAFLHKNISFVVENIFRAADEELQCNFWNEYCADCLEPLIKHPVGNYIIQRLFDVVESQSLFETMSDTIGSLFETILSSRHYGIFLSIAGACNRLKTQQSQFMKNIMQCLQCLEPEDRQTRLIPLILGFSVYNQSTDYICLQGSLLAQAILKFQKPIKAVNSMLSMKPQELSNMACHTQGCHVLNTFFSSPNVGEKNKDKLIQCMKPCLTNLACVRSGALTLSRLWVLLTIKQKSIIAQQFTQDERTLQGDKNGYIILKKFGIFHFKKNNLKWKEIQNDLTHTNKQDARCK